MAKPLISLDVIHLPIVTLLNCFINNDLHEMFHHGHDLKSDKSIPDIYTFPIPPGI